MPRVVMDQLHKFNTDDLFVKYSQLNQVQYSGHGFGTYQERKIRFLQDCQEGKIEITFIPGGLNLELLIRLTQDSPVFAPDSIDLISEPPKVHMCSHFILNGVCVRWRGWIDRNTLQGQGKLELDETRANAELQRLQNEMEASQAGEAGQAGVGQGPSRTPIVTISTTTSPSSN